MKLVRLSLILALLLFANFSFANVWMDENFDDGIAFDDVDVYSYNALANPVNLTHNGTITTSRFFDGTYSYQLSAGQSVYVTQPYQDQANGPFQYFQFAVSLDSIPSPGDVGIFRWNWTLDTLSYSFYVKFVSTGSIVNIVAGEDSVGSTSLVIGSINDAQTWKFITVQVQKNTAADNDTRPEVNQTGVAHGAYFYVNSKTPGLSIALGTADLSDKAKDWSINVSSGSLFLDTMYWEGGLPSAYVPAGINELIKDLETGLPVADWMIY